MLPPVVELVLRCFCTVSEVEYVARSETMGADHQGVQLHILHFRNNRVQSTRTSGLWADEISNLKLSLAIDGADGDLVLAAFRRSPGIVPDHP